MKFRGGYNIPLKGKPSPEVIQLPEPEQLFIPLFSERFDFTEVCIKDGDTVQQGQVLARDPAQHGVPLLAPRGGTVKAGTESRHLALENLQQNPGSLSPEAKDLSSKLLELGAWQYMVDALTGDMADPAGHPRAIIVSLGDLEPFRTSGEVLLEKNTAHFEKGLEQVLLLAGDKKVYLAMAYGQWGLMDQAKKMTGNNPSVEYIVIPAKYPFDNVKLLAQKLELAESDDPQPVWALDTAGVIALGQAVATPEAGLSRIIAIGGPGAKDPKHAEVMVGYPVQAIRDAFQKGEEVRVINGGVFTGEIIGTQQQGLDVECQSLTLVPEKTTRDFIGFARVGIKQNSFSNTFLSTLIPGFKEASTTGIRGEPRPCLFCGACHHACAAGIMPFLVRRYTEKNRLVEAERFGLDLCVRCGLCSYVCTSKIDTKKAHVEGQEALKLERQQAEEKV
jgi:Na+-transporting NADH:ubiquinone oxidoreductase subunit A